MKETRKIYLKTTPLQIYRCDPALSHNIPEEVLAKAEGRQGERSWIMGNKSWDLCVHCVFC
ncbi:hypothetical protein DPMN_001810 [Dreissena polymorpha]|uniref:Uncharacterized protein n=1 Tax=Dreissena polymorpha TaxID=45954 RepID=A0A9D4MKR8_DREPO|nr:hypothetical protein DPMN_001810 [Dreissena polymorpha]